MSTRAGKNKLELSPGTQFPPPNAAAGWYTDPGCNDRLRWWDGVQWSRLTDTLPPAARWERSAFSFSTVVGLAAAVLLVWDRVAAAFARGTDGWLTVGGSLVPLLLIGPLLLLMDRTQPGPWWAKGHALLMGAGVAMASATVANLLLRRAFTGTVGADGATAITVVVAAPVVEELAKWFGVRRSLKQGVVDTPLKGAVYAGFVALGFTVMEDVLYLASASASNKLGAVFVLRCLVTPFAHATFTALVGVGVGLNAERREAVWPLFVVAATLHVAWNACALWSDGAGSLVPIVAAYAACLGTALLTSVVLIRRRNRDHEAVLGGVAELVKQATVTGDEVAAISSGSGWRRCVQHASEGREMAEYRLLALRAAARAFAGSDAAAQEAAVAALPRPLAPVGVFDSSCESGNAK